MSLFTRSPLNPILKPRDLWWEAKGVLNPGAALYDGRVALVYRAVGADGISRFGIAWTTDGERIDEQPELPWYEGSLDDPLARLGVEDPRITALEDAWYLSYCKVSLETADTPPLSWEFAPFRLRSGIGITRDFGSMTERSLVLPQENTKDTVLFPDKVDGLYTALTRSYPSIQYTTSSDLIQWSEPITIMEPRRGTWEGERIGAGPPPIRTHFGWLLIYHGNEYLTMPGNRRMYRTGLALLGLENPARVRYRHPEPIFGPEAPYECEGPVGNVVFATGLVELGDRFYLYYGAADGVIGVATAEKKALFDLLPRHD
jgi:predicted GH43/DUF377 family glycosyl hydrolase